MNAWQFPDRRFSTVESRLTKINSNSSAKIYLALLIIKCFCATVCGKFRFLYNPKTCDETILKLKIKNDIKIKLTQSKVVKKLKLKLKSNGFTVLVSQLLFYILNM